MAQKPSVRIFQFLPFLCVCTLKLAQKLSVRNVSLCFFYAQALEDIEYAIKMLKQGDKSENPVDRHYHSLACELKPLDHTSDEFKVTFPHTDDKNFTMASRLLPIKCQLQIAAWK
jgi:hypothetical protein